MNVAPLALFLLGTQLPALPGDHEIATYVEPDGSTRTYRVGYERLSRAPSWNPERGSPPLPMERAVHLARAWLIQKNPKFEGFRPARFTLQRVSEGSGIQQWVWAIGFDSRLGGRWLSHPSFEVYVLMDGFILLPEVAVRPRGRN